MYEFFNLCCSWKLILSMLQQFISIPCSNLMSRFDKQKDWWQLDITIKFRLEKIKLSLWNKWLLDFVHCSISERFVTSQAILVGTSMKVWLPISVIMLTWTKLLICMAMCPVPCHRSCVESGSKVPSILRLGWSGLINFCLFQFFPWERCQWYLPNRKL